MKREEEQIDWVDEAIKDDWLDTLNGLEVPLATGEDLDRLLDFKPATTKLKELMALEPINERKESVCLWDGFTEEEKRRPMGLCCPCPKCCRWC